MRIAVLTHIRHRIAPPFMGGMEAHAWHLSKELVRRGHDVTVFCSGDSDSVLPIHPIVEDHYEKRFPWHVFHGTDALNDHLDVAFRHAVRDLLDGGFDVVHNNSLHRYPPRASRAHRLPMITSLHIPPFDALRRAIHESEAPWHQMTVTSGRQIKSWWQRSPPPDAHVLYNGVCLRQWPFHPEGDGTAVCAGRITPTKGTALAVQAAKLAGIPLTLYGVIEHQDYFDETVVPHLGPSIRYGGHLTGDDLADAVGSSSALLFTPCWDEPFGLVAIEALASGVPVAAIDNGAVREVVGPCGCFAPPDDVQRLASALRQAMTLSRSACRQRAERLFSIDRMVDRCEALYEKATTRRDRPFPSIVFPTIELDLRMPLLSA